MSKASFVRMLRIFECAEISEIDVILFRLIDTNKDGYITLDDIQSFQNDIFQNMKLKKIS